MTSYKKLLRCLALFAVLLTPIATVWGQTHPYAGVWYITNNTNSMIGYWVPAANPQVITAGHVYEDAYFSSDYSTQNGDPEKPFLTTYPTGGNQNSVWVFVPVSGENNYYYIVHALTGKYLKFQTYYSDARRKYVHLETVTTPGDTEKYLIEANSDGVKIKPKNHAYYMNVAGDNQARYNGGTSEGYYSGMIGGYNQLSAGSKWNLESTRLSAPTITYNSATNKFVISYDQIPVGFDILYTTDGSTPGGATTDTVTTTSTPSTPEIEVTGTYTVKAVVARYGYILTEMASLPVGIPDDPTITLPTDCNNLVQMSSGESPVYYTLDGTTPNDNSMLYIGPLALNEDATIKAIAYNGTLHSDVTTVNYTPSYTIKPTISHNGINITISGAGTIYYTDDGTTPTTGSTVYTGPITLTDGSGNITFKAVAKDGTKGLSCVAEMTVKLGYLVNNVEKLNSISPDHLNDYCIVTNDFNASGLTASISGFTGTFDGGYYTISGLTKPLFTNLDGGTVKNVAFSNVNIPSGTNVGAVCDEADGTTKIYNCGILSATAINGTNAGGLVGHIKSESSVRVVNCYNFANVSGSSYAAGIVGKNDGTVSSDGTVGNVRIALCMMYGNVTGASNISPVYGGNHVSNVSNYTEYNYWRYQSGMQYTALNDQLPVREDEYLSRFPFYRHIFNSHRELAAFFLFGSESCNNMSAITTDNIAEIGHWILKKDVANYPIIEPWPTNTHTTPTSTNNNLPSTNDDYAGKLLTDMGTNGYLSVSVIIGANTYSVLLPITDMDTLNYDFTWGKVVLPFANEFEVNSDYTKICTGWKITGITGGTPGTFSNYNVSDRNCTNKDLYSNTGFIFAQGGNYIVPYNVKSIEITANFARAYYLSDNYYEIVYSGSAAGSNTGYTGRAGRAGATPTSYNGQPVYNTLNAALNNMTASGTVHEQAVVLVGNYHWDGEKITGDALGRGYTIMSIDADNNQEPDYALYSNHTLDRPTVPPTRFDFLAMIPLGMSSYLHGSVFYPNIPIWKPYGWFEITETGITRTDQFEIDSYNFNASPLDTRNYRCIINGGYFTQMVRSNKGACTKLSYYQIGGKAYIKEFYPGNHSKKNFANTLVPINVTGGEIEQCFMTGYGLGTVYGTDIYFWCAGGRIHKFLGAYMEKPKQTSGSDGNVNLTAKIDHARIYRFFGGGTTSAARITGNINITINNSLVDFYCGGPEFGDMETASGKTVTTTADHTTFREYYGAGFGGTAITYTNDEDNTTEFNTAGAATIIANGLSYPSSFFSSHYLNPAANVGRLDYKTNYGIGNCYKYEYIMHSRGHAAVARFYTGYAMFSLAKAGSVTNTLTNCTVEGSFYGAGCQGTVDGTVTSTLTDCTILHSAYGGGYKAESNEVEVYTTTQASPLSIYYGESGVFSDFGPIPTPEIYTWEQGTAERKNVADAANHKLYTGTDVFLSDLGNVTGAITLTLNGHTVVSEHVFGGGNESKSLNNTTVTIKGTSEVTGNVYGGGNNAAVNQNTTVNLQQGTHVFGNVYGGGNNGVVGGKSAVKIQD